MGRYPTQSGGRIVPVTELGFEIVPHERRHTTNHHMWFNRASYQDTRIKQVFRGLLPHVVTLPVYQHQELHDIYSAPVIPKEVHMVDVLEEYMALNGVLDVVREKKTNQVYQIEPDQWQQIKGLYRSAA